VKKKIINFFNYLFKKKNILKGIKKNNFFFAKKKSDKNYKFILRKKFRFHIKVRKIRSSPRKIKV
jgi:hypothetical protein